MTKTSPTTNNGDGNLSPIAWSCPAKTASSLYVWQYIRVD